MAVQINRWILSGNLTRSPELKHLENGTAVCNFRIANNTRVKRGDEWTDKAHFFDVVAWGSTAENCDKYLEKGSPVFIDGRGEFQEWENKDGDKRQRVVVIVDSIQFTGISGKGPREEAPTPEPPGGGETTSVAPGGDEPVATAAPASAAPGDDEDIPF